MGGNEVIVSPSRPCGPATRNESMLDDLLHCQTITRMVNQSWHLPEQLRHHVRSQIHPPDLVNVLRSLMVKVVSSMNTCEVGDLGMLENSFVVLGRL